MRLIQNLFFIALCILDQVHCNHQSGFRIKMLQETNYPTSLQLQTPAQENNLQKKTIPPAQEGLKIKASVFLLPHNPSLAEEYREYIKNIILGSTFFNPSDLRNIKIKNNEIIFIQTAPMSGVNAVYSQEIINGINAHFYAINNLGGIDGKILRLVTINDSGNPLLSQKIANECYKHYGLKLFFGCVGNLNVSSMMPLIKDTNILMLFPFAHGKTFLSPYLKFIINGINNREMQLDKMLELVGHTLQIKEKVGIFFPDDDFGRYQAKYLESRLKEMKIAKVFLDHYNPENPTIINQATKFIEQHPNALISLANYMLNARLFIEFMHKGETQTTFVGPEDIFFAQQILGDFIEEKNREKNIKAHCVTFVPSSSEVGYKFVRDYVNDMAHLSEKIYGNKHIPLSPLSLAYYLNAKALTSCISQLLCQENDPAIKEAGSDYFQSQTFAHNLIHVIENQRSLDLGDFYLDFDYLNRCAYPIQPNIL